MMFRFRIANEEFSGH